MLIPNIVEVGHPVLKQRATIDANIGPDTKKLVIQMREAIKYRQDAISISAPQIGYLVRMFVTKYAEIPVVVNPKILQLDTAEEVALEGCLSLPNQFIRISRPKEIEVSFVDGLGRPHRKFLAEDVARIFLHEYDHLEGLLIVDHENVTEEIVEEGQKENQDVPKEGEGVPDKKRERVLHRKRKVRTSNNNTKDNK